MPPTHKKAVTYGRRGRPGELTQTFEALSQRSPKKTLSPSSKLPSPSASPLRSPFTALETEKSNSTTDIFDVPSSDDEPRLNSPLPKVSVGSRSNRSTPDLFKTRKQNLQTYKTAVPKVQVTKTHAKPPTISHHNELFSLSFPAADESGLLLSERPAKRQRTSVSSKTSSPASNSVENSDSPSRNVADNLVASGRDDTWEIPLSDTNSRSMGTNLAIKSKPLQSRFTSNSASRRGLNARTLANSSRSSVGSAVTDTNDLLQSEQLQQTPPSPVSPSSTDPNDASFTPRKNISTNPPTEGRSTPKQAKLWDRLLRDQNSVGTPSKDFNQLTLGRRGKKEVTSTADAKLSRRKGLIDALITSASGVVVEDDYLSENSNAPESDDEDYRDIAKGTGFDPQAIQSKRYPDVSDLMAVESEPEPEDRSAINNGQRKTYGGHRSYLKESENALQGLLDEPLDLDGDSTIQGLGLSLTSSLLPMNENKKQTVPAEDDLEDDLRGVKTVYDLRAAGDMEHFTDEVNEIIDDLSADNASLSRKRMALLDLHKKLLDPIFLVRFNQHGHGPAVFRQCTIESDAIMGAIGAAVLVQAVKGSIEAPSDAFQLYDVGCLPFLKRQLANSRSLSSIASDRQSSMSKVAQGAITSFTKHLSKIAPWKEKTLVDTSPKALALVALETLIRRLREQGSTDALLDESLLAIFLNILESQSSSHQGKLQDEERPNELFELDTILSLLESCTTTPACTTDRFTWTEPLLRRLSKQLELAMLVEEPAIKRLTPRLALNLANGNEAHAKIFAKGAFVTHIVSRIRTEFDALQIARGEDFDMDVLLLCLGAMLNLAEHSHEIRGSVIANDMEQLDALVSIFLHGRKKAEEADSLGAVQANVAYGWLAVLLGNLCRTKIIQHHVAKQLPGKNLGTITAAVDEFVRHHRAADQTAQGNESYAIFTQRLQGVADLLRDLDK